MCFDLTMEEKEVDLNMEEKLDRILLGMVNMDNRLNELQGQVKTVVDKVEVLETNTNMLNRPAIATNLGMTAVHDLLKENQGDDISTIAVSGPSDELEEENNKDQVPDDGNKRDSRIVSRFKRVDEVANKLQPVYNFTQPST